MVGLILTAWTLVLVGRKRSAFQRAIGALTRQHATRGARSYAEALDRLAERIQNLPPTKEALTIASQWCKNVGGFESSFAVAIVGPQPDAWESADGRAFGRSARTAAAPDVTREREQRPGVREVLQESIDQAKALMERPSQGAVRSFASSTLEVQRLISSTAVKMEVVAGGDLHDDR